MKKYKFLRCLAFLLAAVMLIASFPIAALAQTLEATENETIEETITQPTYENATETELDDTEKDVYILAEDTTKRGEFEKHYLCSDGTFVAVTYAEAVHYRDDNGEWTDIDNSLSANKASGAYEAQNGDYKISFHTAPVQTPSDASIAGIQGNTNGTSSNGKLISMQSGDSILSWTLTANKVLQTSSGMSTYSLSPNTEQATLGISSSATISVLGTMKSEEDNEGFEKININDESAFALPKVSNTVRYDSLFGEDEGISVRYTAYRNKIEEDIFIERKTDIESFSMSVDCTGLIPVLNSDNSIDFLDKNGEMQYHISIPYMIDAAYAVLNDIQVTLSVQGEQCIITYTPDSEWMNSSDRVYPIMLDPSVTTKEYRSNVQDTYFKEGDTTDHSDEQYLDISYGNIVAISFSSLPVIHESMPIQKTTLNLTLAFAQFNETQINLEMRNPVVSADDMTYNDYLDSYVVYSTSTFMFPSQTAISFNWTGDFQETSEFLDDTVFVVKLNEDDNNYSYYPICSSENTNGAGPYITIKYGYAFANEFNTGDSLSFKNADNGRYIDYGAVPNSTAQTTGSNVNFTLVKNEDTGGYKIRSTANSSLYLTVNDTGGVIWSSDNIPERQEWLFVPTTGWTFYIVLRGDMSLALAVTDVGHYMNEEWVITGGNLCCIPVDSYTCTHCGFNHQEWYLYENGVMLTPDSGAAYFETGTYYINNVGFGGLLSRTRELEKGFSWDLGDNVKWQITNLGNNQYVIQPYSRLGYCLSCSSTGSISLVVKEGTLTDNCIWIISEPNLLLEPTLLTIKNKAANFYLYFNGTSLGTCLGTTTDNGYKWRIVRENLYKDVTASNLNITDVVISKGSSANLSISDLSGANFISRKYDFEYDVISGALNASINSQGVVSGLNAGYATIKATHKTTGAEVLFNIDVYKFIAGNYYLLKNKETKKYIQPHMSGISFIVQNAFSQEEDQLWELIYNANGYYKIKNKDTNLYLTAAIDSSSGSSVFSSEWLDPLSSHQLWKFTELPNGMHKIQAMSHEGTNLCLSVGNSSTDAYADGITIQQKTYTNDSDRRDEWWIGENYTYIEFSFDHEFVEIHRTSTETFAMAEERLSNIILNQVFPIIKNAYLQLYGIEFKNTQTRVLLYTSDADACPNKDANGHCVCITEAECNLDDEASPLDNNNVGGFEKESHCDSAIRLRNNLITNIPENTIRISFTGYIFCFYDSLHCTHSYNALAGLSSYSHPTIIINQKIDVDPRHFILVIAHEIAHLYGVQYHHEVDPSAESCIMMKGRYFYGEINPLTNYSQYFCTSCESCIASNRYKWR